MPLFQKSVLRKHLNELDKDNVAAAYKKLKAHFGDAAIQQNIRDAKEEEYQEGFVRDLFVNVLGYTLKPQPDYNFVLEKKNEKDSKKSDGAILLGDAVLAAVELKGTNTVDLDHVEAQAFGYKNNQKGCRYVVVSNFEKLRFYVDDSVEHLEFDLFKLNADDFAVLYLCLQKDNLLKNLPAAIKEASVNEEQGVTKKLYKDYSTFKRLLYQNICEQNPGFDKLVVYKKTQKLLDRFLFILFAEDKQLLPPNSIREILKQWQMLKDNDAYFPLYNRYQLYFGYMNTGHKGKVHDIFAYNGGLFAADEVLDTIKIDDQLLYDSTFALSQYDFETEVDVNILGHIFEHSLNDVDAVTAESEGKQLEKEKTRRKKDGVFYTPKYITKYIVENTVGKLCAEKKTELEIKDEDYSGGKKKKDKKALNEKLESYRQWLLQLTILDPACGSGAFLNQALEFLIAEHRKVDELRSKLFEDTLLLSDVENHILENNLFGVDLNEESIEIAKLSLWLRTAKKGRKLSSLNSNIKCGNSLIDDKAVAGDKAFVWNEEFKEVFAKGGFDVVVGNPPYVLCQQNNTKEDVLAYYNKFQVASYKVDLFHLFFERSIKLLNENGQLGFITPNTFLTNKHIKTLREFILNNTAIEQIIQCEQGVFFDASVDVAISLLSKNAIRKKKAKVGRMVINGTIRDTEEVDTEMWVKEDNHVFNLKNRKLGDAKGVVPLGEIANTYFGIQAYDRNSAISVSKLNDNYLPIIDGADIPEFGNAKPKIFFDYRTERIKSGGDWNVYSRKRIVVRQIGQIPIVGMCDENILASNTLYSIYPKTSDYSLEYILAILNSSWFKFHWKENYSDNKDLFPKIKGYQLKSIPIRVAKEDEQAELSLFSVLRLDMHDEFQTLKTQFLTLLQSKVALEKPNGKLQNWYVLEFKEFVKELAKAKIILSLTETNEWLPFFAEQKKKAMELKNEIEKTDKEIDRMVYALYELTEEEVKIVEGR